MTDSDQPALFADLPPLEAAIPADIKTMHLRFGALPQRICGDCQHFVRYKQGARWSKCNLTRQSNSTATDWRARYPACGRFSDNRD